MQMDIRGAFVYQLGEQYNQM
ncbi:hypothetical protein HKBW3S33_02314, partial [Candidatus Hakubella thermalkaliphila]